jgi:hypothetical protein
MVDFSRITGRLFTGGGITDESDVTALLDAGVNAILDVTSEEDDSSLLLSSVQHVPYLWNPTADDGTRKPPEWFQRSLLFALPLFGAPPAPGPGGALGVTRLYAHCSAGRNRGPSTCYAVMRALGWDAGAAQAIIRQRRPVVELRYADDADDAIKFLGYE